MAPGRDLKIGGYVVAQFPNAPLLIAAAAALAGLFLDDGTTADDVARSIFYVALSVWAYGKPRTASTASARCSASPG